LEVVVAYLVDEKGVPRVKAAWGAGMVIFLLGIPSSLSLGVWSDFTIAGRGFFDTIDYLASNVLLPMGGIFIALFAGWVVYPRVMDADNDGIGDEFRWAGVWCFVAPAAIAWILVSGL
jgi:NSS family neurotransmitter:Na+ symporter